MKKVLLILSVLSGFVAVGQEEEEDPCAFPTNKKILKLLQNSQSDKYTNKEQFQFLKDALKQDENCIECKYAYALKSFNYQASQDNPSYDNAEQYFNEIIQACPKYHSDAYYYLGIINYSRKDNPEALRYFRLFLEFKSSDGKAFAEDYATKKRDVQEIVPEIEFNEEFFKKPVPFSPQRVNNISTEAGEYLPMLSPDNQIIFFTREVNRAAKGDITSKMVEEFSMAYRTELTEPFDIGTALQKPFNVGPNYGGSTLSIDNKEMIICACKDENPNTPRKYKNCDLFSAHYEKYLDERTQKYKYRWTELANMGPGINTPDGWEAQPSLSSDGNTLFFVANRPDTRNADIFYANRQADGTWSTARPVGGEINSDGYDKTPFIHSDSKTLYFCSETGTGRLGAGGFDIFYSRMDEFGKWSKPKNLGYPINSAKDEVGLVVSSDGKLAYFASNTVAGSKGWDIYAFELYLEARPEKITIVKGDLIDVKGDPVTNARVEIKYAGTGEVMEAKVDTVDGKFVAAVKSNQTDEVVVTVKKDGHSFSSKLISVDDKSKPLEKDIVLSVEPIEKGKSYTINDILFATASYELTYKSKFVIDQFIDFLKENKTVKIEIQGHTDNEGDPARNLVLSENRAKSVMDYIVSKGVEANRLTYKGYGETKPKVPNNSVINKAKNRRTVFFILET
ncbi:MAG: OmpA family protein [Flavobacteriales bacterium]